MTTPFQEGSDIRFPSSDSTLGNTILDVGKDISAEVMVCVAFKLMSEDIIVDATLLICVYCL